MQNAMQLSLLTVPIITFPQKGLRNKRKNYTFAIAINNT
jgi:hypothetical protein